GTPEVKLGLIPGAGGTQRLPRAIGVAAALDIVTTGRFVPVEEALELGLLDAIATEEEAEAAGVTFAKQAIEAKLPPRPLSAWDDRLACDSGIFEETREKLRRRTRGQLSPLACVDAVEAATQLDFDAGMQREREIFQDCMNSPQRAALIHAFFGERAVAKVPGLSQETHARPLETIAVIGAGTMGGGIAMAMAAAGLHVCLIEQSREALDKGLARIRKNLDSSVSRGSLTPEDAEERLRLIRPGIDSAALTGADFVIEAVFESMEVKRQVFAEIDAKAKPGAVLATNTSYLDVDAIAAITKRPEDVLGTHFFSPANVMRLLEVVRAEKTSDEALKTALALGKKIGKVSVVAGVCDGFIGNRMLQVYQRQANYMLEDGALPQQVDAAMTAFGFAMGPFAVADLAGIDIGHANRRRLDATRDPQERYVDIADKLFEMGRLGQKTGAGWYRYEEGNRKPIPDSAVEELVLAASKEKGIARRVFSQEEIQRRALCALANEGARILEEGIAARPVDIDMVWIHGYGFPAHRGGPMFWADARGLDRLLADIEVFAKEDPQSWQPAPLLERLAKDGGSFKQWSEAQ
ncbi:MAG: 3-hydroxyacyl-CoA dehydrogenase NAD-binding domain-containing protein, partial [Rhodovibrionaceae bacterium]